MEKNDFEIGQKVRFKEEYGQFIGGETAFITKVSVDYVDVSNKPDDYCAQDGADGFKFESSVPIKFIEAI